MNLQQVVDPTSREFLNGIPTSFSLTDEEVDALIETGGSLLRDHPVFQALMADFESSP
jgi:hypothetical protein